jgi:hypothetical protein
VTISLRRGIVKYKNSRFHSAFTYMGWYQMSEGRWGVLRREPEGGKRSDVIFNRDPESSPRFARRGILSISTGRTKMPDEPPSPTLDTQLTTNIVAAYVRRNQIGGDQLPIVISTVDQALVGLGKPGSRHGD